MWKKFIHKKSKEIVISEYLLGNWTKKCSYDPFYCVVINPELYEDMGLMTDKDWEEYYSKGKKT